MTTRTVLCYGDSNTWGADPKTTLRLPKGVRWPGVMARGLDGELEVIEEGLPGRTTMSDDPYTSGLNGRTYLGPCLASHTPLDLVILMLGTNDLKAYFGLTPDAVARGTHVLADMVLRSDCGPAGSAPALLIVAPVPVGVASPPLELFGFEGAAEKSRGLASRYALVAEMLGCAFFDAASAATVSAVDGVHLDPAAHTAIGLALAHVVRGQLLA